MEELMKTKIFKVTVERLLLNGGQTLYMVGWSLLVGTIIGMILALILVLCRKGGLAENRPLYWIVSAYINVVRSIPFVILLVTIMPITRAIRRNNDRKYGGAGPVSCLHKSVSCKTDGKQPA